VMEHMKADQPGVEIAIIAFSHSIRLA
jgi:hypothetical protein